jgi:hypothetical protein
VKLKIAIAVVCIVVLGVVVMVMASGDETITFKIVDRQTGLPVTNVTVLTYLRWTRLPLERLRVPGLSPWRDEQKMCEMGTLTVAGVGKVSRAGGNVTPRIHFLAPGYGFAVFLRKDSYHGCVISVPSPRKGPVTQDVAVATSVVTIELDRDRRVSGAK